MCSCFPLNSFFVKALISKMAWGMYSITGLLLMKRQIREAKGRTEAPVVQILMPLLMLVSWRRNKNRLTKLTDAQRTKLWQENAGFLHNTMHNSLACVPWAVDLHNLVTTALSFLKPCCEWFIEPGRIWITKYWHAGPAPQLGSSKGFGCLMVWRKRALKSCEVRKKDPWTEEKQYVSLK